MSQAQARVAALCAAAGYPEEVRELIAQATFPGHERGRALSNRQLGELADAVKVLAQAGRTGRQIPVLIAHYQAGHGERWREAFWRQTLRTAASRAAHPELHAPRAVSRPDVSDVPRAPAAWRRQAARARTRRA